MEIMERIHAAGIVPVVVINDASDAVATADALSAGGIELMEITMRTGAALDAMRAIARERPRVLMGAGTVVTPEQCRQALDAGAGFIVSPGLDAQVALYCAERGIPVLPGCVTPTEIMAGLKLGLKLFKFFPAGVYGGLKAMKALSEPFGGIKFVPTGGVNGENLEEYLGAEFVQAVGGSWMCRAKDISEHQWAKIAQLSAQATATVRRLRG